MKKWVSVQFFCVDLFYWRENDGCFCAYDVWVFFDDFVYDLIDVLKCGRFQDYDCVVPAKDGVCDYCFFDFFFYSLDYVQRGSRLGA